MNLLLKLAGLPQWWKYEASQIALKYAEALTPVNETTVVRPTSDLRGLFGDLHITGYNICVA